MSIVNSKNRAKLIKYDFSWAGKNKKALVERFTLETNAKAPEKD